MFVAVKPICDSMGLAWNRQRKRIQRDTILSEGGSMVELLSPGGAQETLADAAVHLRRLAVMAEEMPRPPHFPATLAPRTR